MRSGSRVSLGAGLVLLLPLLLGVERPPGLGDVADVRTWSYPQYTRVVVELTDEVEIPDEGLVRLAANRFARRPERLYLDIPGIWVGRRFTEGIPVADGLLEGVRLGQNTLQQSRLVIDLERYEHHRLFTLSSPPRIVVDVYADRKRPKRDASGRLPAEMRRVHTIVVDPGHGGRDPGALGVGGLREKHVNLAIAKRLASRLRERGFHVVLTRNDDRTLDLEQRTAIAESAGGDVFISIHANASRRKRTRGIEIYTLDQNHERHSLDVAARENGVPASKLDPLQRALARLRVDELGSQSERLASLVHANVIEGVKRTDRSLPDLGLKKGPFYVLFMSSMSSVLVETGFLTNHRDAKLLKNPHYQQAIADEIAEGVHEYRQHMEHGTISAARLGSPTQGLGSPTRAAAGRPAALPPVGAR
jgi:N-acetylmuramoyl-L-alanine amidase